MSRKSKSNLIWNAHIKQLRVEGERVIAAFNALQASLVEAERPSVVATIIGMDTKEPEAVSVPYWAIKALAERWKEYEGSKESPSLGQVFGLEGVGRGRHKSLGLYKRRDFYVGCAIEVQHLRDNGVAESKAIEVVAMKHGIETAALRKALMRPEGPAKAAPKS